MICRLIAHDMYTRIETTLMEAEERAIVKFCFKNWPQMKQVPIFEWFFPHCLSLSSMKYMIRSTQEEQ